MRPKSSVSSTSAMMTAAFSAMTAGRNCTCAIHDSHWWAVPVMSTKSSVMPMNITAASVILIFLNMFPNIYLFRLVILTMPMLAS